MESFTTVFNPIKSNHTFVIPRKQKWKNLPLFYFSKICKWKVGDYFLKSDNIWSGQEGPNGSNLPQFHKGIRKEKILTKIDGKLDMLQATFRLFFCWDILVSARYEVGEKKFGQKVSNVLQMEIQIKSPDPRI